MIKPTSTSQGIHKLFAISPNKFLLWLIGLAAAFIVLNLLTLHFQVIYFEYPLEYRENTDLFRSYLLSIGKNIFAYENFPSSNSQYGFVYPWLGSKFFGYTGIHFYPLRLITALAILPLLGLFLWQGVKEKLSHLHIFLICGIVYASCLIHVGNLLAMPNTLGLAFFSLSGLLPPLLRFNKPSLIASCIFAGLGFFTKIYFGIGAFYILFYLLVNKRWRDSWFMLICLISTVGISIAIAKYLLPSFYETNIELNARVATWQPKLIWKQSGYFIMVFFGFIALFVSCKWLCPQSKIFTLKNPYFIGLVLSSIVLLKMGAYEGQFFLYFQQLLIPFLVPLSIQIIKDSNNKIFISILLFLNLLLVYSLALKHNELETIQRSFLEIESKTALLISNAELLYDSPTSYFAIKLEKSPNEHGQVGSLTFTKGELGERYLAQFNSINENIRGGKYQQIFIDEWQHNEWPQNRMNLLYECYSKSNTFKIVMYAQQVNLDMWVPNDRCKKPKGIMGTNLHTIN